MARLRKAGSADYRGKLNAAGSYLLDQIKGTGSKYQSYREIDEVFPEKLTRDNADESLLALAPRTPITGIDSVSNSPIGGEAILDSKGRVNLDQIPFNPNELSHTAPDAVNSDADPLLGAFLNPNAVNVKDLDGNPSLSRAVNLGKAMSANDTEAYRRAGMPVEVTDEAAEYLAGMFTKGKNNTPLRSSGFVKAGGLGTDSRAQILIPGTDTRFVDASKDQQGRYMDDRNVAFVKQWLGQGGASIGNVRPTIVAPGKNSHMDHVQALSSSVDTVGADGWGYSDSPSNFSYLDAEANVHAKLNYSLQGQYRMMKLADEMRRQGRAFPARLTQTQLGDPNRKRLTDEGGAIRMATDKASGVTEAGENLLSLMQMFPDYI
jgi:hypothetical protein